jgi:hypothetical protein
MTGILLTSDIVRDTKSSPCHCFVITESGLDVIDIDKLENAGYISYSGGFTSLSVLRDRCDKNNILLGTSNSGIVEFEYTTTTGEMTEDLEVLFETPLLPSNNIICLDRKESVPLCVGTTSGITVITSGGDAYSHICNCSVTSCFVTSSGDVYYSPLNSGIYVKYGPITSGWTTPDYYLNSTSTPALSGNRVNSVKVTKSGTDNHVFLATNSGISAYSENRGSISSSPMRYFGLSTFSGSSINVSDLEVFPVTTLSGGHLLFSTFSGSHIGEVSELLLSSGVITKVYNLTDFETISGGQVSISGSKFLHRSR